MKQLKYFTIIGIIFVLITGSLAHFLYDWTNHNFTIGLFTPINESVWEHMKLLFFPMLIYLSVTSHKLKTNYPCISSSLCFGILLGTLLIPISFYGYTCIFKKDIFILDIGTFILSTIISFIAAYKFTLSCKLKPYSFLLYSLVAILFVCFVLFTLQPPDLEIFDVPDVSCITMCLFPIFLYLNQDLT